MANLPALVRATGTITSGVVANAETITVAGKTYTFQTTLTNVDGNVNLGASNNATMTNLAAAINLDNTGESATGPGNDYAAATKKHPLVRAAIVGGGATLTITSRFPGNVGNFYLMAEATTGATLDAALAGGSGDYFAALTSLVGTMQVNSEVIAAIDRLDASAV